MAFMTSRKGSSTPVAWTVLVARCPPEDCGGTYGYEDFLRAIEDPTDPEHDSLLE